MSNLLILNNGNNTTITQISYHDKTDGSHFMRYATDTSGGTYLPTQMEVIAKGDLGSGGYACVLKSTSQVRTPIGTKYVYIYLDHLATLYTLGATFNAGTYLDTYNNHIHIEISDNYTGGSSMTTYAHYPGNGYSRNGGVQYKVSGFSAKRPEDYFYSGSGQTISINSNAGGTMSFRLETEDRVDYFGIASYIDGEFRYYPEDALYEMRCIEGCAVWSDWDLTIPHNTPNFAIGEKVISTYSHNIVRDGWTYKVHKINPNQHGATVYFVYYKYRN
jgi:hypothetical protein